MSRRHFQRVTKVSKMLKLWNLVTIIWNHHGKCIHISTNMPGHKSFKNVKTLELGDYYLESPWEMHSYKYKHAWYRFRNLTHFENFEKQTILYWHVNRSLSYSPIKQKILMSEERYVRKIWRKSSEILQNCVYNLE